MKVLTENYEMSQETTNFKMQEFQRQLELNNDFNLESKVKTENIMQRTKDLEKELKEYEELIRP